MFIYCIKTKTMMIETDLLNHIIWFSTITDVSDWLWVTVITQLRTWHLIVFETFWVDVVQNFCIITETKKRKWMFFFRMIRYFCHVVLQIF